MAGNGVVTFTDPQSYQAAIRPAQAEVLVTAKGDFQAELTRVELPRLWMQRSRESLPRVVHSTVCAERPPIFFLTGADQAAMHHSGMDVSFGDIIVVGSSSTHHHRSDAPCHWATLSLTRENLATSGHALAGRDLTIPSVTHRLRPSLPMMSRLLKLHEAGGRLAQAAPPILARPEPVRALEEALVHAMIMCLIDGTPVEIGSGARQHAAIIARFEELLAVNHDRPLYLAEICAAIRVSERTLRVCCQEHLGMGPVRYLWLRRMHLARGALILATPATATVTGIAMDYGFWELGRFAGKYRALFGESPSASLRRPPDDRHVSRDRPLALPASEIA
jgi:AraC-like DNA-binding protein